MYESNNALQTSTDGSPPSLILPRYCYISHVLLGITTLQEFSLPQLQPSIFPYQQYFHSNLLRQTFTSLVYLTAFISLVDALWVPLQLSFHLYT